MREDREENIRFLCGLRGTFALFTLIFSPVCDPISYFCNE